jgi:hypothetical protein
MKTPFTIVAMLGAVEFAEANSFCDTIKQHVEYTIVLFKDDSTGGMAVFNKGGNDGLWSVFKSNRDDDLYKGGPCGHRFDDKSQTLAVAPKK